MTHTHACSLAHGPFLLHIHTHKQTHIHQVNGWKRCQWCWGVSKAQGGDIFSMAQEFHKFNVFWREKSRACSQAQYIVYKLIMQRAFIFCLADFSEANLSTAKSSLDYLNFFCSHSLYSKVCNSTFLFKSSFKQLSFSLIQSIFARKTY